MVLVFLFLKFLFIIFFQKTQCIFLVNFDVTCIKKQCYTVIIVFFFQNHNFAIKTEKDATRGRDRERINEIKRAPL